MDPKIRRARGCCASSDSDQSKEEHFPVKKPTVEKYDRLLPKEEEEDVSNKDSTVSSIYEWLSKINFTEERRAEYREHVRKTEGWVMGESKKVREKDPYKEDRAKYTEQIRQSGGYDVDKFPEMEDFGIIVPLLHFKEDPEWINISKHCSILAIEKYNEEKELEICLEGT